MAALAAIVDHDHARALNELLQEGIQLRQQLERQRQQLEQQRIQMHQQELQIAQLQITKRQQELQITQMQIAIAWAHHNVQRHLYLALSRCTVSLAQSVQVQIASQKAKRFLGSFFASIRH